MERYAATIDAVSGFRSSADSSYGVVAAARFNVTIVTEAEVRRILFDGSLQKIIATGVEIIHNGQTLTVKAEKEVILAAGAFHTPKLLELSGVGEKQRLGSLGIPHVLDVPRVGENLQNHLMSILPVLLRAKSVPDETAPGLKALVFVRLDHDDQDHLLSAVPSSGQTSEQVIRSIIQSPTEASASMFLAIQSKDLALLGIITSIPLSRGCTHISSAGPDAMPAIDAGFLTKDLDLGILARHVKKLHELAAAGLLEPFFQPRPAPANWRTSRGHFARRLWLPITPAVLLRCLLVALVALLILN